MGEWSKECILFMVYITTLKYMHDLPKDAWNYTRYTFITPKHNN